MRISTSTIFQNGGSQVSDLQSALVDLQAHIASGKRIATPQDDPVAASQALNITQSQALNDQYATNRTAARNALQLASSTLTSVTDLMQTVKSNVIAAGNGSLNDGDRANIAQNLQQVLQQMLGYANSTDGTGNYIFAGFSNSTPPFAASTAGAIYGGDQGVSALQVATSTQMNISAPGSAVFGNIRTSAGQVNVVANSVNAGQAAVTASSIANPAAMTGDTYAIVFGGPTSYNVLDKTTGQTVLANQTYTSGTPITFAGYSVTLTNSSNPPAPGDKFTVQPGNQDIFETLTDIINLLKTPVAGNNVAKADLAAGLSQANGNLEKSLSNVLNVSTQFGINLQGLTTLDSQGDAKGVVYAKTLSSLQDLDYAKAITQMTQQQTTLQAAQQSFVRIANLSLFNYING